MKRVLMIAYHFPPFAGSSGIQRTLRFVQHLPQLGWQPLVLTANARAYEQVSEDLLPEIPANLVVERAFALNTSRHLAIAGRYPTVLACPDRWMTWQFGAIPAGLRLIRKWRPDVLWSTYPIATAHVIGHALHRRTGLPWIADFRDPMAQDGYPADRSIWRSFQRIEKNAIDKAVYSVFTTPSAAQMYRDRYPYAAERVKVLENGFDEESFVGVDKAAADASPLNCGAITLLHSGVVYPSERDPSQLFAAIGMLAHAKKIAPQDFKLRFRAAGQETLLGAMARDHNIESFVELLPPMPYREALEEMLRADALLVLQAANCNEQIPAKLYEYLRAGRPILGLTDPLGDTAQVIRNAGIDTIAPLDSIDQIAKLLIEFITALRDRRAPLPRATYVAGCSRRDRTKGLFQLLEQAAKLGTRAREATAAGNLLM